MFLQRQATGTQETVVLRDMTAHVRSSPASRELVQELHLPTPPERRAGTS